MAENKEYTFTLTREFLRETAECELTDEQCDRYADGLKKLFLYEVEYGDAAYACLSEIVGDEEE